MVKDKFYANKHVVAVQWWLHEPDLPEQLLWARLCIFNDGSADSTFGEKSTNYGFVNDINAAHILCEDEYIRFDKIDEIDEQEYGLHSANDIPPKWNDASDKAFEFLGTY